MLSTNRLAGRPTDPDRPIDRATDRFLACSLSIPPPVHTRARTPIPPPPPRAQEARVIREAMLRMEAELRAETAEEEARAAQLRAGEAEKEPPRALRARIGVYRPLRLGRFRSALGAAFGSTGGSGPPQRLPHPLRRAMIPWARCWRCRWPISGSDTTPGCARGARLPKGIACLTS